MIKNREFDGNTPFVRINKTAARNAWNAGRPIVFCPVKLAPFGAFRPSCMLQKNEQQPDFDKAVESFVWYNCQLHETGYYPAYYVADVPPQMEPFEWHNWHAWTVCTGRVVLSDESVKKLRDFADIDAVINWLFLEGQKDAARALNKHAKAK